MATSNHKISFKKESKKKEQEYVSLTLDEYDALTLEHQIKGAGYERGKIIAELERRAKQLREFSEAADLVPDWDMFVQHARGVEMAARIIPTIRKYEDNVGCPECEAF